MIDIIERIGFMFLTALITFVLMAAFMLMEEARKYLRDRNRREEAEARARFLRENPNVRVTNHIGTAP